MWFETGGLKARLLKVEATKADFKPKVSPGDEHKKPQTIYKATVEIQIERTTRTGVYPLRVVSYRGVSNSIRLPVVDQPTVVEGPGSHQNPELAQAVTLPAIINGRLEAPGELDYYSFHARKGEQLKFEVVEGQQLALAAAKTYSPEVALYRAGGSWFDPHRPTRLLFKEEQSSDLMQVQSSGTFRFDEDGQYLLQVSGVFGEGCPDCTYHVRVRSGETFPRLETQVEADPDGWSERSFRRRLADDWIATLKSRSIPDSRPVTQAKGASSAEATNPAATVSDNPQQPLRLPSTLRTSLNANLTIV